MEIFSLGPVLKRAIDLAGAAVGLVTLLPILMIISLSIYLRLGTPVLFSQRRPGRNGHVFVIRKFRTMSDARGADGRLLSDVARLGPLGRLLRRTSLDELPELWNVIKGDMSLVGPRPLLMEYLPLYSPEQARRHEVRPGITGLAQVSGRNSLSWEEKFRLDVWYVDNWSLWLDLKILWRTVAKVIFQEGISSEGEATAAPFKGSGNPL